nr:recombinase family protein [Sphingomonas lenta]
MGKRSSPNSRAAQYVRMSTDQQRYSIDNQLQIIAEYASANGFNIVETYEDLGRSGLTIGGRRGLSRLICDVQSGNAEYSAILVYDVSRWGRFQDVDESAYYEFVCKAAGVSVHYCSEPFSNDTSLTTTFIKLMKRAMAGEYSRELSAKTFAAHIRGAMLGFHQGGSANFGLRRVLLDNDGKVLLTLERGQRKALVGGTVVLVPGPQKEVKLVQQIFRLFVNDGLRPSQIADLLNKRSQQRCGSADWTEAQIRKMLVNERYIGESVYGKRSHKLKGKRVDNPPELWIRGVTRSTAIVDEKVFRKAGEMLDVSRRMYSDEYMLHMLQTLFERDGHLTIDKISQEVDMPSPSTYVARFGSISRAYDLVGCPQDKRGRRRTEAVISGSTPANIIVKIRLHLLRYFITADVKDDVLPLRFSPKVHVNVGIALCFQSPRGTNQWRALLEPLGTETYFLLVRLAPCNRRIADYYLLPSSELAIGRCLILTDKASCSLQRFHLATFQRVCEKLIEVDPSILVAPKKRGTYVELV